MYECAIYECAIYECAMKKKRFASMIAGVMVTSWASAAEPVKLPEQNVAKIQKTAEMTDEEVIQKLYRGAYAFWQQIRNDNGTYQTGYLFNRKSRRGSVSNAGLGLVALTIGHINGWEPEAEQQVLQTLRIMAGKDPEISVPRNAVKTYINFYNTETGKAIGDSWSPIDSAIMMSGAMFAARYFSGNSEIEELAQEIYQTTDLTPYIASVPYGEIYLASYKNGSPKPNRTKVFNESMIVASIARQQAKDLKQGEGARAIRFWDRWYKDTRNQAKPEYNDIEVLGVNSNWFISNYSFLLNNYLVHEYSDSAEYQQASRNAAAADYAWWRDQKELKGLHKYEWGSGAGACPRGYCVDQIQHNGQRDRNVYMIVSPHTVAGFLPYSEHAKEDLVAMYRDERGWARYLLKEGHEILWRYSYKNPEWRAESVQGIDFSAMLFGLAAMEEHLGMEFFNTYNNYFSDQPAKSDKE